MVDTDWEVTDGTQSRQSLTIHAKNEQEKKTFTIDMDQYPSLKHITPWDEVDIFRMSGEELMPIQLLMTSLAKNLLLEEYPLSTAFVKEVKAPEDAPKFSWQLETQIRSVLGAGRFVMGLRLRRPHPRRRPPQGIYPQDRQGIPV